MKLLPVPILVASLVFLAACGDNPAAPSRGADLAVGADVTPNMTEEGCRITPGCWPGEDGENVDPDPAGAGYWLPTYEPASCLNVSGVGINDADGDGIDERCEARLAEVFRPSFNLAPTNYDCDRTMEPYWAAKWFPDPNVVRIIYLLAYHRDCGSSGSIGNTLLSWIGTIETANGVDGLPNIYEVVTGTPDATESHSGDSEWITVEVSYNDASKHWYTSAIMTSAHYATNADGTRRVTYPHGIEWGDGHAGGYPSVWVSANKHANYVTRDYCNAGRGLLGIVHDNCDANTLNVERFDFSPNRNIGSLQHNFLSAHSCVGSLNPTFYPGTECFWKPDVAGGQNAFNGWLQYPYGGASTAYLVPLLFRFECYQTSNQYDGTCLGQGVVR